MESKGIVKAIRILATFVIVTLAWVIFRSASIGNAFGLLSRLATTSGKSIADIQSLLYILVAVIPLLILEIGQEFFPNTYGKLRSIMVVRWTVYLAVFAMIVLLGVNDSGSFIYVSF